MHRLSGRNRRGAPLLHEVSVVAGCSPNWCQQIGSEFGIAIKCTLREMQKFPDWLTKGAAVTTQHTNAADTPTSGCRKPELVDLHIYSICGGAMAFGVPGSADVGQSEAA